MIAVDPLDPLDPLEPVVGLHLIVAVARGGAIGRAGGLPWHAPEDLAHFKATTLGHAVILGSVTWASIGRPLPGRRLIVVSSRRFDVPDGVELAPDPQTALTVARQTDGAPVLAGGTTLYEALLADVVRIHRTDIDVDVPDADAFFPPLPPHEWIERRARQGEDERLTFRVLDRRTAEPGR